MFCSGLGMHRRGQGLWEAGAGSEGAPMATEGRAGAQGGRVRAGGERLGERVLAGGTCTQRGEGWKRERHANEAHPALTMYVSGGQGIVGLGMGYCSEAARLSGLSIKESNRGQAAASAARATRELKQGPGRGFQSGAAYGRGKRQGCNCGKRRQWAAAKCSRE